MAVLPIRHFSTDPALRQKAKRIHAITDSTQRLIDDMIETMRQAKGVGLAAPQVGVGLRVIVVQMPEEQPVVIINPEITEQIGARR